MYIYLRICQHSIIFLFFTVTNKHEAVSTALINRCVTFWKSDKLAAFVTVPVEVEVESEPPGLTDAKKDKQKLNTSLYIFADILAPVFVHAQMLKPKKSFEILGNFLVQLLKSHLVTISFLNGQCVKLLRHEWEHVSRSRNYISLNGCCR